MTLPAPNLDDRRFQDLVDDAKRFVQQRCPEWTDHNVSDPGVTLIETFAFAFDQILYRLNRVPDRTYVKFLELMGVRLFPPVAARAGITFWLSAAQPGTIQIPAGTPVATERTEMDEAITFTTTEDLAIVPSSLATVLSSIKEKDYRDHTERLRLGESFHCFDRVPKPDDQLLIGLPEAVPSCAVLLRFDCTIQGVGVDPTNPPLVWEAWDGRQWVRCGHLDETGGLNRAGDVIVHVPRTHQPSTIFRQRAGWLRCRVIPNEEWQAAYSSSPNISGIEAMTIGGTVDAVNAEQIENEILGMSDGGAGQRFSLQRRPVVLSEEPLTLEVAGDEGWELWSAVDNFARSAPDDRHFVLDPVNGEIALGPAVREPDGSVRQYGALPPKGRALRVPAYRTGGGKRGNVSAGAISILKTTIPFVHRVENRARASGGVDGEDIENAKQRGPIAMRARNRAVTAEDYQEIARAAAPEAARVQCVPAGGDDDAGAVRVLIVPHADDDPLGALRFEQLVPSDATLERIAQALDECRVIGARVVVEPPAYQGVTVAAKLVARPRTDPARLRHDAVQALNRYFHPIRGGPDGNGWPFGRPVHIGEVYSVLQRVRGIELVEDARLLPADLLTGERGQPVQRIDLNPRELAFSYEHQVVLETP